MVVQCKRSDLVPLALRPLTAKPELLRPIAMHDVKRKMIRQAPRNYCYALAAIAVIAILILHITSPSSTSHVPIRSESEEHTTNATTATQVKAIEVEDDPSVAIIASTTRGVNTRWLQRFLPTWQHHIYTVDDPTSPPSTPPPHKSAAYLTYILSNYQSPRKNTLPDYAIFTQGVRYNPDNDDPMYDLVPVLKHLNQTRVDEEGYLNLRCTWQPGCDGEAPIRPSTDFDPDEQLPHFSTLFGRSLTELFPNTTLPAVVRNQCCAQFALSKARILSLPRERYETIQTFLQNWSFRGYIPESPGRHDDARHPQHNGPARRA